MGGRQREGQGEGERSRDNPLGKGLVLPSSRLHPRQSSGGSVPGEEASFLAQSRREPPEVCSLGLRLALLSLPLWPAPRVNFKVPRGQR